MGDGTLTASFNNLDKDAVKRLGSVIGDLASDLYQGGCGLQRDDETGHPILIVCIEGECGSGKSTLAAEILTARLGKDVVADKALSICVGTFDLNSARHIPIYQSQWSSVTGQQNRLRDCYCTMPFRSNAYATLKNIEPRKMPGLEILEHPGNVPPEMRGVMVSIDGQLDAPRSVRVSIPQTSFASTLAWDGFIRASALEPMF